MAIIQIKYSTGSVAPSNGSLEIAELAYSQVSEKLFIGNGTDGAANVIGGAFYTHLLDANTSASVPDTIITRDSSGSFYSNVITANSFVGDFAGDIDGNASTATRFQTPVVLFVGGSANGNVTIDGSSNVNLNVSLSDTNVTSGTYGNTRYIPTFTVGTDGRITEVSNVAIDFPGTADFAQYSYDHANSSFDQANVATTLAQNAYNFANTIVSDTQVDPYARAHSNAAFIHANSAFDAANSAVDPWVRSATNVAASYANSAYLKANTAGDDALAAIYLAVNTSLYVTNTYSNVVDYFFQIASIQSKANSAFDHANAAYDTANTKLSINGGTLTGDLLIQGNLSATGTVTYINTNNLNVGDNIITLNGDWDQSTVPTQNAGIEIERGAYQNASLIWNETVDRWQFTGNTGAANIASDSAESYANAAFAWANSAYTIGFQGFDKASDAEELSLTVASYANSAFIKANSAYTGAAGSAAYAAFLHANAAFAVANLAGLVFVQSVAEHANAGFDHANAAFSHSNSAYSTANSGSSYANAAFAVANSGSVYANSAFVHSNNSYDRANTAATLALQAYDRANATALLVGGEAAYNAANAALETANSALELVQLSADYANAAFDAANVASSWSNSAFAAANTKLSTSGGTLSGDLSIVGNLSVTGTRTTLAVSSVVINDNLLDINAGEIGYPTSNAGIRVLRGDELAVQMRWNEAGDRWELTKDGTTYYEISSESQGAYANAAFENANTVNAYATAAFATANIANERGLTGWWTANDAYDHANAAFDAANTKFDSAGGTITGDVTVVGELIVDGNTTYFGSITTVFADNIITVNSAISNSDVPVFNAGLEVNRGFEDNVFLLYNETSNKWTFTNDGSTYSDFVLDTELQEVYDAANTSGTKAIDAGSYANAAFLQANTPSYIANSAAQYANAAFERANSGIQFTAGSFPPGDPGHGDRWLDTDLGQEFVYVDDGDSTQWIEITPFVDQNVIESKIYYILEEELVGQNIDSNQSLFGVSVPLAANTVYTFESVFALEKSSGTTPHSIALNFGGTLTINHILFDVQYSNNSINSIATPTSIMINTVSSTNISGVQSVNNHNVRIKGVISVNTAGTLVPEYTLSASPGAAFTVQPGSYFRLEPIGSSGSNINIGSWT